VQKGYNVEEVFKRMRVNAQIELHPFIQNNCHLRFSRKWLGSKKC